MSYGKKMVQKARPLIKCLIECKFGSELIVSSVRAGHMAKKRLAHLGIVPGVKIVKKKAAPFRGPIEIIVRGTSLVLGRGLAAKINIDCSNNCKY
ncbi:MAG: ferrous iron transport protein A [Promethearchaeota archaeon]